MLHQYNQNDINREPQLLKKWITNKVNETKKEKETSKTETKNNLVSSKKK
jgi:hypothetical protein